MIWHDGTLPHGAPAFSSDLSSDLLDHGYGVLSRALRLREMNPGSPVLDDAFRVAAEAIEATVRRGSTADQSRGFQLLVSAVASHLAGYSARAYSLVGRNLGGLNLSSDERLIALIARRSLGELREECIRWLGDPDHDADRIVERLGDSDTEFGLDDALSAGFRLNAHRAVGLLDSALARGDAMQLDEAIEVLRTGRNVAAEVAHVSAWWVHVLLHHLCDDLWKTSLWERLPALTPSGDDEQWASLRQEFIEVLTARSTAEITLWPSQLEAAARASDPDDDLVVALPTSAGKTRIAELCILRALADRRRVVYLTPLRALSAQQERTLWQTFRPLGARVTSLYGASGVARADTATFESAQIVVATPEKLDFALRHQPSILDDVGLVILDEGHMIGIDEREVRYEALVQRLLSREDASSRRLVCLSAIFGSGELTTDFTSWIRSDSPGSPIESDWRPTRHRPATVTWNGERGRLEVQVDSETPFVPGFLQSTPPIPPRRNPFPNDHVELVLATADKLVSEGANVLVYCTQRNYVESVARNLLTLIERGYLDLYPVDGDVSRAIRIGEEWLGADHVAAAALAAGVAVHHGGLPRAFLGELEELLSRRVLRYAIASPTVAQGLDLSASALVFHSLHRSGSAIEGEEYKNVIGRVGRAFVDMDGLSVLPVDTREAAGRRKLALYRSLVAGGGSRSLESGIALLIDQLIDRVVSAQALSRGRAIEYLLNQTSRWSPSAGEPNEGFDDLVANLDAAILSTVEDLDIPTDAVAATLDAALRNSLWRRTLDRRSPEEQAQQRHLLVGRAAWIWDRTTGPIRRGFFASGLGFDAGAAVHQNIDQLFALVIAADMAIERGELGRAAQALGQVEDLLAGVRPLQARNIPPDWQSLLSAWISGATVADHRSEATDFVQDGLVYRLVWAVEAIRAHAEVVGAGEPDLSGGQASMALTYGVPTLPAATLLRHGLPSRRLAVALAERYPPEDEEAADPELSDWIASLVTRVDVATLDTSDQSLWEQFVVPPISRARPWSRAYVERHVDWLGEAPTAGTEVRVVLSGSAMYVCALDLTPLGVVDGVVTYANKGIVSDDRRIVIERFGPPV
jgi:superfamily II DNA/RNA helicase